MLEIRVLKLIEATQYMIRKPALFQSEIRKTEIDATFRCCASTVVKVEVQISNSFQRATIDLAYLSIFSEAAKNVKVILKFYSTRVKHFSLRFVPKVYFISTASALLKSEMVQKQIFYLDFNLAFNNKWGISHVGI